MTTLGKLMLGAAVVSLASHVAIADSTPMSLTVRFGDLSLGQSQDVARLYNRIRLAAGEACGPRVVGGFYTESADYRRCFADTMAQTITRLDRPAVTAYYRERVAKDAAREQLAEE